MTPLPHNINKSRKFTIIIFIIIIIVLIQLLVEEQNWNRITKPILNIIPANNNIEKLNNLAVILIQQKLLIEQRLTTSTNNNNNSTINFTQIINKYLYPIDKIKNNNIAYHLTKSYLNNSSYVIAIQGGSPSTYEWGYANRLHDWLKNEIGIQNLTTRNGAIGSMTQWFFAGCMKTILGDENDIDLMLWEFAVNEDVWLLEGRHENIRVAHRAKSTEVWLRQVLSMFSSVSTIGFVHLYTYDVYGWEPNMTNIPETCRLLEYSFYASKLLIDYYYYVVQNFMVQLFAINVIGTICELRLMKNRNSLLKDRLHPTQETHQHIADLLSYWIIINWLEYLSITPIVEQQNIQQPTTTLHISDLPLFSPQSLSTISLQRGWEFPSQKKWISSCFMASLPQRLDWKRNSIQMISSNKLNNTLLASMDPDPRRKDRVTFTKFPSCGNVTTTTATTANLATTAGFHIRFHASSHVIPVIYFIFYLTLRGGKPTCRGCGESYLKVWFNGKLVEQSSSNNLIHLRRAQDTAEEVNNWILKVHEYNSSQAVIQFCSVIIDRLYFVSFNVWERVEEVNNYL
jgi:hypothetical protein